MSCMKKWNQKLYQPHFRRLKKRKSITETQVQENRTKIFEFIAMLLVVGCLVSVAAAAIFIALVGIFWLFWLF